MTTRKELVRALRARYGGAAREDRIRILDEFVALTGYHRKHAIRLLGEPLDTAVDPRSRTRLYDEAVRQALTLLWEAADRVCGKAQLRTLQRRVKAWHIQHVRERVLGKLTTPVGTPVEVISFIFRMVTGRKNNPLSAE